MADEKWDVVVVGGGLGGLLSAIQLAVPGRRVLLLERAARPGGRAISNVEPTGHVFNLGPHALYRAGAAAALLQRVGIPFEGGVVKGTGGMALKAGRLHTLPVGPVTLLTTNLVRAGGRLELAATLARLIRKLPTVEPTMSIEAWLEDTIRHDDAREVIRALIRLATYSAMSERLSAAAALSQLHLSLTGGVMYLNGGWQSLVDAARARATEAGVIIEPHARVDAVGGSSPSEDVEVTVSDGRTLRASSVVLAVGPEEALRLLPVEAQEEFRAEAGALEPVRAACLDLGLARLPMPRRSFALGIDAPVYGSVHSAWATLAHGGGATLQLSRYLQPGEDGARALFALEELMDAWQPGWRQEVRARRFLPNLTVMHALPTIDRRRPTGTLQSLPRVHLVGDWVGPQGMLLDAVACSAQAAVARIQAAAAGRDAAA